MFKSLGLPPIGVRAGLARGAELASRHGFAGLHININEAAALGVEATRETLARYGVRPSALFCPMHYALPEADFEAGLARLPGQCETARALGIDRTATWIPSWHDELDFARNYALHVDRLGRMATLFKEYGIRLGLEFLGPQSLRAGKNHAFIHTMDGMLRLCDDIGTGNLGLLFDCWHWYTAGGTMADFDRLRDADVVEVHVNDAPAGVPFAELQDRIRALPGETGVIDVPAFLRGLARIGYSGPVLVEPFSQRVNALPEEDAVRVTGEALDAVWKQAGLS